MSNVLVLNKDGAPLQRVGPRKAINMIVRGVAEVEEADPDRQYGVFPYPVTIRLTKKIKVGWRKSAPKYSKRRLFIRDNWTCAYGGIGLPPNIECTGVADTIDHVLPASKGGRSEWLNTVAACFACNNFKDDRTPEQAGMTLLWEPYVPTWQQITT